MATRRCPRCAEEIQADALVCRYCGTQLEPGAETVVAQRPKAQTAAATATSLSSQRGFGGFAALAGGALMIISVFLPWLSSPLGQGGVTGWDTFSNSSGIEKLFVENAFSSGFSPMFGGLSVLVAGALMAFIGLALLASLVGSTFKLPGGGKAALVIITLAAFVVGATNLASLYATADSAVVTPEYGLFLLAAGALIGLVGVIAASSKGRS